MHQEEDKDPKTINQAQTPKKERLKLMIYVQGTKSRIQAFWAK